MSTPEAECHEFQSPEWIEMLKQVARQIHGLQNVDTCDGDDYNDQPEEACEDDYLDSASERETYEEHPPLEVMK